MVTERTPIMNDPVARSVPANDLADEYAAFGPQQRGGADLRHLATAVRSNLPLIGTIILAVLALALAVTLVDTPRYTAAVTIQINDSSDRVIGENDDSTARTANPYDTDRFLKTQTDILRSRGLAVRVAHKLKLQGNPEFYSAMEADLPATDTTPLQLREQVIKLLTDNLDIDLPRDSRIVTVAFDSADPVLGARIANAFAGEFIQSNLQRKFDSTAYARDFVSSQLSEAKVRVAEAERALNDYARAAGLIHTGDAVRSDGAGIPQAGGSVTTASLVQLNSAANQARADRITAEGRWQAISNAPLLGSREVLANTAIVNLMTDRARAQAALEEDLSRHLDDYPTVREKRAELTRIETELQTAASAVRGAVRADYQAALVAERQLKAQVDGLKSDRLQEQDRSVSYALLQREADTNQALYEGLLQRYNELNATVGISSSNTSIIDAADPPQVPTSPNLLKNLVIALILGVGLAGLVVFTRDQLDDAVRVPDDVEHKLRLPLLGVIPKAHNRDPDHDLLNPKSPVSEAYNSLRGALLYSTSSGMPRIMLVTSAEQSEGKTTTSYATATALARIGRKVVLIDADLRRPSVHRRIGYSNERGLTSLLTSTDAVETALQTATQDQLFLLPSGPLPPSPTELLSSVRMAQLIAELSGRFDVIVIDSPPILGLADAPMLSALVDGVIFVVESSSGHRGALKAALRRLRSMRANLLGGVLTKFDPARSGRRYSEYYAYEPAEAQPA